MYKGNTKETIEIFMEKESLPFNNNPECKWCSCQSKDTNLDEQIKK